MAEASLAGAGFARFAAGSSALAASALAASAAAAGGEAAVLVANIAATLWRTVSDTGARRYFFESAFATAVFWVDVLKLDLAPGAAPRKLAVSAALAGEVSGAFLPAEPFTTKVRA